MAIHVAILKWPYIRMILDGQKTIESRLTKIARPPYRRIQAGDHIYFKASSGPFMAKAVADKVSFYDSLTPRKINALRRHFNRFVCGDDSYWQSKCDSRYATLITLRKVTPITKGPNIPPSRGLAWFVLDQADDPKMFQVALTPGAIRNRYVRVPQKVHQFPPSVYGGRKIAHAGKNLILLMPDGDEVRTDLIDGTMFRWRGWGSYFDKYQMQPGDAVQLTQITAWRYRVAFVERYRGPRSSETRKSAGSDTGSR